MAWECRRAARQGIDPATLRNPTTAPTFTQAVEFAIEARQDGWKDGGRTADMWRSSLERHAYPAIGRIPVDRIATADLVRVLRPIWHTKRATAKKVKVRMGVVMNWAVAEGHRTDDPAGPALTAALPRNGTKPVEHRPSLPADKLGPALERLDGGWPPVIACLRFIAATACRSGEARNATWVEIDRDAEVWIVPATRTKTEREHVIPLSAMALAALDEAHQYADGSGLVFPSARGKTISDGVLARLTRAAGFSPHGCRASFRSWAAEQGVNREVAEAALAHSAGVVERAYQRSDLLEARRAVMQAWSDHLA